MKTNTLLFLSTVISVVILLLIGGVMYTFSFVKAKEIATQTKTAAQDAQFTDSSQIQLLIEREAAYQTAIREANDRLVRANQNMLQLQEQLNSQQSSIQTSPQENVSYSTTPEQAVQIAQQVSGGRNVLRMPELVNLDGKPAYEVVFPEGNVYVDPENGQVIQNDIPIAYIDQAEAVRLAENYLGKTNISQVRITSYNNADVFQVNFENGEFVLIDMKGQIVLAQPNPTSHGSESARRDAEDRED